ncbi:hypothetical protein EJ110_NYTH11848 [Nymphaea thermarum]|nr:hypothetical protein EJ110_NYTH11848 [Nymphaea thermarum]
MEGVCEQAFDFNGFSVLPSELIENIILRLPLPEIICLSSACKGLNSMISSVEFQRKYNKLSSDNWIFVFKKQPFKKSTIFGFSSACNRWFRFPIAQLLEPVVSPGEDIYLLAASAGFFLFSLNNCQELVVTNPVSKSTQKIPTNPLGRRGTSSWRRPSMKLIGNRTSGSFKFMFIEDLGQGPVLYLYRSATNMWSITEAQEMTRQVKENMVFLTAAHIVGVSLETNVAACIYRPSSEEGSQGLSIGLLGAYMTGPLHIYGDGRLVVVRSESIDGRSRAIKEIEIWGLNLDGRKWKLFGRTPHSLLESVRKPFEVLTGRLEDREGVVRVILVSYFEGRWNMLWISYDSLKMDWHMAELPEFGMKGINIAGVAISSPPIL